MRQRPPCFTRKTLETLPFASLMVAVAFTESGTSMFSTAICALDEKRFRLASLAQLPLVADFVTESASFGVKICVQIRFPSPCRLAVCRSVMTCLTAALSSLLDVAPADLLSPEPPPHPASAAEAVTTATTASRLRSLLISVTCVLSGGSPGRWSRLLRFDPAREAKRSCRLLRRHPVDAPAAMLLEQGKLGHVAVLLTDDCGASIPDDGHLAID